MFKPFSPQRRISARITGGPAEIVTARDHNLWFTETYGNRIGKITPAAIVTEYTAGMSPKSGPDGVAADPDGNLWFTDFDLDLAQARVFGIFNRIGRVVVPHQR